MDSSGNLKSVAASPRIDAGDLADPDNLLVLDRNCVSLCKTKAPAGVLIATLVWSTNRRASYHIQPGIGSVELLLYLIYETIQRGLGE